MDNFDNVLLAIATNIPVLLMTAFVLQGHIWFVTDQFSSYTLRKKVQKLALGQMCTTNVLICTFKVHYIM